MVKKLICFVLLPLMLLCAKSFASDNIRIVSLAPNITEIIYALDMQDNLIGRSDLCDYPQDCTKICSVGSSWKPNTELIVSMQPSIVLASSLTDENSLNTLRKAGINTVRINNENSLEGTYNSIVQIGTLIGKKNESVEISKKIESENNYVKQLTSSIAKKKKALYLMSLGDGNDYVATGDTFINGILECAGLKNIAKNTRFWSISKELLLISNPDIVFIPDYALSGRDIAYFTEKEPYSKLKSEFIVVDGNEIERQGIRTSDAVKKISLLAYPEIFR